MSLRTEQSAFALDIIRLLIFAYKQGYEFTFGEAQRPIEMQEIYVRMGRSKTLNSNHLKKLAFDINFFKDGVYLTSKVQLQDLGKYWESLSPKNSWGGNWNSFKDIPHFERRI